MTDDGILDQDGSMGTRKLEGAGTALAMGIVSIVFVSIIGVLLGIIGIVKSNTVISEYNSHPNLYDEKFLKRAKAGKVCAIIGLLVKVVGITILIIVVG